MVERVIQGVPEIRRPLVAIAHHSRNAADPVAIVMVATAIVATIIVAILCVKRSDEQNRDGECKNEQSSHGQSGG